MLGNYLEVHSKSQASDALRKLLELQAEETIVLRTMRRSRSRYLMLKSVKVRLGEKISTDGIIDGQSAIAELMITGESLPVEKDPVTKF